jgi:hypothetical protein
VRESRGVCEKGLPVAIYQLAGFDGMPRVGRPDVGTTRHASILGGDQRLRRSSARVVRLLRTSIGICQASTMGRLLFFRRRAHQSQDRLVHLFELIAGISVERIDAALERGELSRQCGVRRQ